MRPTNSPYLLLKLGFFLAFISFSAPIQAQPKILAIGDSLTFGYEVSEKDTWTVLLQQKLQQKGFPKAKIINAGTSGATSAFGATTLRFHLNRYKPDLLILALGANDGLRGLDTKQTYQNLHKTIQLAQKQKIKILLIGMKAPPNYGQKFPRNFEQIFLDLKKKTEVAFYPFLLEGVAGQPKLNNPDGIHPNKHGYKIIADNLLSPVLKALQ